MVVVAEPLARKSFARSAPFDPLDSCLIELRSALSALAAADDAVVEEDEGQEGGDERSGQKPYRRDRREDGRGDGRETAEGHLLLGAAQAGGFGEAGFAALVVDGHGEG